MVRNSLIMMAFAGTLVIAGAGAAGAAGLGEDCGGVAGTTCDESLWCDPNPGLCGGADVAGKCIVVPEACTLEWNPVCGCNDKTYSNDCHRRGAKVWKKSNGACKETGKPAATEKPATTEKPAATAKPAAKPTETDKPKQQPREQPRERGGY